MDAEKNVTMDAVLERLEAIETLLSFASKEVLTADEVAMYLGYSKSHVYKLTCAKKLPYYKPTGGTAYFKKSEIEEWMLRNRQSTNEEIRQKAAALVVNRRRARQ